MGRREQDRPRIQKIWNGMIARCYRPYVNGYKNYGGRGIRVCDEWRHSYKEFAKWAYSNGFNDNSTPLQCSLDRIDSNGNYCPENCRWVDATRQQNHRRNNHHVVYRGKEYTISELSREVGMQDCTLRNRICCGWSIEDAVNKPIKPRSATGYTANEKPVAAYLNGTFVGQFSSATEAAEKLGVHKSGICNCIHGRSSTTHGYSFAFIDGDQLRLR